MLIAPNGRVKIEHRGAAAYMQLQARGRGSAGLLHAALAPHAALPVFCCILMDLIQDDPSSCHTIVDPQQTGTWSQGMAYMPAVSARVMECKRTTLPHRFKALQAFAA